MLFRSQPQFDEMKRPQPEFLQGKYDEIVDMRIVPYHTGVSGAGHEIDACVWVSLAQGTDGRGGREHVSDAINADNQYFIWGAELHAGTLSAAGGDCQREAGEFRYEFGSFFSHEPEERPHGGDWGLSGEFPNGEHQENIS